MNIDKYPCDIGIKNTVTRTQSSGTGILEARGSRKETKDGLWEFYITRFYLSSSEITRKVPNAGNRTRANGMKASHYTTVTTRHFIIFFMHIKNEIISK